uniref:Guanylate cyclase n=1 Tax=Cacopsylla melanoneura TaxID=428564 RepID=A0A8D8V8Q4_9HEMI
MEKALLIKLFLFAFTTGFMPNEVSSPSASLEKLQESVSRSVGSFEKSPESVSRSSGSVEMLPELLHSNWSELVVMVENRFNCTELQSVRLLSTLIRSSRTVQYSEVCSSWLEMFRLIMNTSHQIPSSSSSRFVSTRPSSSLSSKVPLPSSSSSAVFVISVNSNCCHPLSVICRLNNLTCILSDCPGMGSLFLPRSLNQISQVISNCRNQIYSTSSITIVSAFDTGWWQELAYEFDSLSQANNVTVQHLIMSDRTSKGVDFARKISGKSSLLILFLPLDHLHVQPLLQSLPQSHPYNILLLHTSSRNMSWLSSKDVWMDELRRKMSILSLVIQDSLVTTFGESETQTVDFLNDANKDFDLLYRTIHGVVTSKLASNNHTLNRTQRAIPPNKTSFNSHLNVSHHKDLSSPQNKSSLFSLSDVLQNNPFWNNTSISSSPLPAVSPLSQYSNPHPPPSSSSPLSHNSNSPTRTQRLPPSSSSSPSPSAPTYARNNPSATPIQLSSTLATNDTTRNSSIPSLLLSFASLLPQSLVSSFFSSSSHVSSTTSHSSSNSSSSSAPSFLSSTSSLTPNGSSSSLSSPSSSSSNTTSLSSKVLTMFEWDESSSQWKATYLIELVVNSNSNQSKIHFLGAPSSQEKGETSVRHAHNGNTRMNCGRENCDEPETDLIWWIAPIVTFLVPVVIILLVSAFFLTLFRRQYSQTRFSKGPYKIILTPTDFVFPQLVDNLRVDDGMETMLCCWLQQLREFGGPPAQLLDKSHSTGAGVDKPDLLKGSIGSLQGVRSVGADSGQYDVNVMDRKARYNGDLVQMKPVPLHGHTIELKSKSVDLLLLLQGLRHENLNPFIGFLWDPSAPALVWEFCCRGSLEDVLVQDEIKLDWTFRLSLLTDLVRGMRYLHSVPHRLHGNLTSRNCVIDARWVLKITDYSLGSFYELQNLPPRQKTARELLWTAPELLRDQTLRVRGTQPGDVYSFGIIVQEVVVRGEPFCMLSLTPEDIIEKLKKPPPLIRPSVSKGAAPPEAINIMRQCWAEPPDMRPDFNEVSDLFKTLNQGRKVNFVDTMFQMLEKYSNNLEDLIRERTEQLDIEKKKTEQLLNRMLPSSVAEKLKLGMPVDPEEFREVTIYFSDIVGFTTISAYSTPFEVVDLLNDLYTCFDATINAYNVYKVETIGDAYMVVGGLPVRILDHADQIATMALDLLHHSGRFKIRHLPYTPLRLRIGLHTGPCCAGVVGLTMPRYCLFGDTVNTASRLESTGAPWRIHLSVDTKEKLDLVGDYELEYRGETELKGKGKMPTYWLLGKKGFYKELPTPPPIGHSHGLDENLILYGRTGPSTPIDFTSSEPHNNTTHSTSFHDNSVPGQSSKENSYPQHSRSPKSQGQNSSKILSQILSLDSTIEDTRQSNRKKYKYMKQNTFDSCFYADSRDETPGEILVDRIDNSNYVNQSNTTSGDSERKSDKAGISLGSPRYNSERIGEKLGISDRAGSPRISIDRVDEKVGICDRVGSPRFDSLRNSDRYSGEKVGYSPRLDVYPRQLDVYGRSHRRGSREGGSEDNHSNSSSEDISPSTNSLKIKLNNECDALVVDRNQKSCSPNSKDSSPSRNGMSRSGRKDSSPGREGTARNNNHVSEKGYSTIEECNEEDRGHSLRGSFSTSSTVNDQGGSMPSGGNVANIVNSNITSSVNNQMISISSAGNSNIFNSISNTSHSSNNLSVQSSAKRFNKCKSIDTSIDEIKYDLVGVSFVNSRSNTNISTICNVNANVTSGGTGSSVSGAGKRKFSIGTNGGSSAYGGNTGVESNVADLSKPYNLYRCLNQGNRYLKRQYSVDKPIMTSESSAAAVVEGNKSVVKIQIHRE